MPNRIIKESICTSDTVDGLSWFEEVVFCRLLVNCDDYGRMDGRTAVLKSRLFPLKGEMEEQALTSAVAALERAGLLRRYEAQGKPYLEVTTWGRHQQIRARKSKYPAPEGCGQLTADDIDCPRNPIQSESKSESNPKERDARAQRFAPPTRQEVEAYCRERGSGVDPARFVDFYASKGWMVGSNPMKDWKACLRTWERRDGSPPKRTARVGGRTINEAILEKLMKEEK